jgi:proteasome assembly chaperone (PAC2) family protein
MSELDWMNQPVLDEPVALLAFEGWGDAGESASAAVARFLDHPAAEKVATLDPDAHFDFQVRRPIVSLDSEGVRDVDWPHNDIYAIRTPERDIVVVLGEEPHYRWKAFTSDIVDALKQLGVKRAVTMGAFVGQVAHTLPVPLVGSANKPDTLALHDLLPSGYTGPTGILGVLNHALEASGIEVISIWAAVPHYLSNQEYPPATEALASKAAALVGVTLDVGELTSATREYLSTVDAAIEDNEELAEYVERLEEESGLERGPELVEEIEDFLRDI